MSPSQADDANRSQPDARPAPAGSSGIGAGRPAQAPLEQNRSPHASSVTQPHHAPANATSGDATEPPAIIGDKYHVIEMLGWGGQAQVFRVAHPELAKELVVKLALPLPNPEAQERARTRMAHEAKALADLEHPNLARVFDIDFDRKTQRPYLVMEYIRGGQKLSEYTQPRQLSPREMAGLLAKVASALALAHARGVLHLDVKPDNIVVDQAGEPRLIDFGMACLSTPYAEVANAEEKSGGTVAFMAPEQARQESDVIDQRSDVFALGATLYWLLTGTAPFATGSLAASLDCAQKCDFDRDRLHQPGVNRQLARICLRAMSAAPEDRYPTAADVANDLERFASAPARRRRWAAWSGVGLLLAGLLTATALYGPGGGNDSAPPAKALRIELLAIDQCLANAQGEHERHGPVLAVHYQLQEKDGVHLRARLSRPAYCFWLAFRPDGVEELCFPTDANQPPPLTDAPTYPLPAKAVEEVYGLTNGVGLQAFVLVVSEQPLPAYDQWRRWLGQSPWRATPLPKQPEIGHHDGTWEERFALDGTGKSRGKGEPWRGKPSQLAELVAWLRGANSGSSLLVDAWTLPVLARGK